VSGRAAGAVVAGLRGVPADVSIADLSELAELLRSAVTRALGPAPTRSA
jgi:hypothetical protein